MTKFEEFMAEVPDVGLLVVGECVRWSAEGLVAAEVIQRQLVFGCELRDRLIAAGLAREDALAVVNAVFLAAEREIADIGLCVVAGPEGLQ